MGKPLMLQEADAVRIVALQRRIGAPTKIAVVRTALDLLERDAERADRIARWRRAARLVGGESRKILRDFQRHSRLRRLD